MRAARLLTRKVPKPVRTTLLLFGVFADQIDQLFDRGLGGFFGEAGALATASTISVWS